MTKGIIFAGFLFCSFSGYANDIKDIKVFPPYVCHILHQDKVVGLGLYIHGMLYGRPTGKVLTAASTLFAGPQQFKPLKDFLITFFDPNEAYKIQGIDFYGQPGLPIGLPASLAAVSYARDFPGVMNPKTLAILTLDKASNRPSAKLATLPQLPFQPDQAQLFTHTTGVQPFTFFAGIYIQDPASVRSYLQEQLQKSNLLPLDIALPAPQRLSHVISCPTEGYPLCNTETLPTLGFRIPEVAFIERDLGGPILNQAGEVIGINGEINKFSENDIAMKIKQALWHPIRGLHYLGCRALERLLKVLNPNALPEENTTFFTRARRHLFNRGHTFYQRWGQSLLNRVLEATQASLIQEMKKGKSFSAKSSPTLCPQLAKKLLPVPALLLQQLEIKYQCNQIQQDYEKHQANLRTIEKKIMDLKADQGCDEAALKAQVQFHQLEQGELQALHSMYAYLSDRYRQIDQQLYPLQDLSLAQSQAVGLRAYYFSPEVMQWIERTTTSKNPRPVIKEESIPNQQSVPAVEMEIDFCKK